MISDNTIAKNFLADLPIFLDGKPVEKITAFLFPKGSNENPKALLANENKVLDFFHRQTTSPHPPRNRATGTLSYPKLCWTVGDSAEPTLHERVDILPTLALSNRLRFDLLKQGILVPSSSKSTY
jgi:hypothetical protein